MSFIDLMQDTAWTEADIKARLHAIIRSEISEQAELEINRALQGAALGVYKLTLQDQQAIGRFKAVTDQASAVGVQARADMALLHKALDYEAAYREWLADPELPTPGADPETLALVEQRGRLVEPEPLVEPETIDSEEKI